MSSRPTARRPTPARGLVPALLAAAAAVAASRVRPPTDLTGRTAVVTGGGSGIGRALCLLLGERGAHVHVVDRDGAAAEAVAGSVRAAGGRATAATVDVTDAPALVALADRLAPDGVDLLVNNAGIGHAGAVADTPLSDWREVLDVDLMGVVHGVHAFLPGMLAQGRPAAIVNTASLAGLVPCPGLVPYSTAKWAVVGLSRGLDRELAGTGVRVHALCPGLIATDIARRSTMRGAVAAEKPALVRRFERRGAAPEVVARAALDAVARGRRVVPTPRWHVLPPWLLERASPRAAGVVSAVLVRAVRGRPGVQPPPR